MAPRDMIHPRRVVIVVQARMSSRRLPGKAVAPLADEPAIVRMMERVGRIAGAAHRVVATSRDPSDDALAAVCAAHGIACARGPLDDVLGRVAGAVPPECDVVVRLTGDCPLVDPLLVDRHLERFAAEQPWAEYVTNAVVRTYPDGLDVEVVCRDILVQADRCATDPADREHVTPWIKRHARMVPMAQEVDLSSLRLVLDTPADYEAIRSIYADLHSTDAAFGTTDIYKLLLRRPELIRVAEGGTAHQVEGGLRTIAGDIVS
jgi:spore coat polysaccharide biosynthesis protein SpsF (cytidylyltransferase family)